MSIFITGTDTDCGKTYVSCALLRALDAGGYAALGMKPIASGATLVDGRLQNADVTALERASNTAIAAEIRNPYLFAPPTSPHIAAAESATEIDLELILAAYRRCAAAADFVVVEGVGGWLVPLSPTHTVADLARALGLPVLLVVGVRLGCINHALLSARAIAASGLDLYGWVANILDPDLHALDTVIESISERLPAPCLGIVGWQADTALGEAALKLAASLGATAGRSRP